MGLLPSLSSPVHVSATPQIQNLVLAKFHYINFTFTMLSFLDPTLEAQLHHAPLLYAQELHFYGELSDKKHLE